MSTLCKPAVRVPEYVVTMDQTLEFADLFRPAVKIEVVRRWNAGE